MKTRYLSELCEIVTSNFFDFSINFLLDRNFLFYLVPSHVLSLLLLIVS